MSKLKKNLAYQTVYQILNTCLPLITSPYLARVLGATQQGVFSYTQSIVNYFTLFAMLGVVNYGTRSIASCGNDREIRSRCFWEIYTLQLLTSLLAVAIYIGYLFVLCKDNWGIACIQGLYILGALIDINWLFFGTEKFEVTVKRSIVIRILSFLGIILIVKKPEDLWIYSIIMSGGTLLSNIILWRFVPALIDYSIIKDIRKNDVIEHIKPNLLLFIPLMAMSVYHIMDKTMLGLFSTYEQTGFYYNADKVINIPIGVINGIGTVMLPRMSALLENGKKEEASKLFSLSVEFIAMGSAAMTFGIAAISNEFTPIFFGKGFDSCVILIIALAPVLIVKSLSQTSRMQYLIPNHLEKIYIESVVIGAITNFVVNIFLISKYGALGAVFGTLVAEIVTCIWQYGKMNKYIAISKTVLKSMSYIVIGVVMYLLVRISAKYLPNDIWGLLIEVLLGGIIYILLVGFEWTISKNKLKKLVWDSIKRKGV